MTRVPLRIWLCPHYQQQRFWIINNSPFIEKRENSNILPSFYLHHDLHHHHHHHHLYHHHHHLCHHHHNHTFVLSDGHAKLANHLKGSSDAAWDLNRSRNETSVLYTRGVESRTITRIYTLDAKIAKAVHCHSLITLISLDWYLEMQRMYVLYVLWTRFNHISKWNECILEVLSLKP